MGRFDKILGEPKPEVFDEELPGMKVLPLAKEVKVKDEVVQIELNERLDPRRDLMRDSEHWVKVLFNAAQTNEKLFGILHGCRCGGARLVVDQNGNYKLMPGEWTEEEWNENKTNYLMPNLNDIKYLLSSSMIGSYVDSSNKEIKTEQYEQGKLL